MQCDVCRVTYSPTEKFCARCGRALTPSPPFWQDLGKLLPVVLAVIVIVSIALWIVVANIESQRSKRRASPMTSSPTPAPAMSPSETQVTVPTPEAREEDLTKRALERFRERLMSVPDASRLFLSVEGSEVPGVARVRVTNFWFDFRPHQKRQMTQMMANLWRSEMSGQTAILHVYDITGREIAGTSVWSGVWIEDE
jgi:hypothetical protein